MHIVRDDQTKVKNPPATIQKARELLDELFKPVRTQLDKYYIADHLVNNVIDHAIQMIIKNPNVNPDKVVRKTVSHFKLKLLTNGSH